jgi:hypothetical protein
MARSSNPSVGQEGGIENMYFAAAVAAANASAAVHAATNGQQLLCQAVAVQTASTT